MLGQAIQSEILFRLVFVVQATALILSAAVFALATIVTLLLSFSILTILIFEGLGPLHTGLSGLLVSILVIKRVQVGFADEQRGRVLRMVSLSRRVCALNLLQAVEMADCLLLLMCHNLLLLILNFGLMTLS